MLESTACLALHIIPLGRSTILFHRLFEMSVLTPIVSVPSGPTILHWIGILGSASLLLIVMDLKERSSSNTTLVTILNSKFIMLLSLE
jgi:hypothetical protein